MQYTLALLGLASIAYAAPQGVTSAISPQSSAPAGCQSSYSGTFNIETVNLTSSSKRDLESRQSSGVLTLSLNGGILKDSAGRTGYIAANSQFQFDNPPQTGAIYTAGWSVCSNGSLAIGGYTTFQQCLSGGFYNLYLQNSAAQCTPISIDVIPASSGASGVASVMSDGQPTATPIPICQLTDGQPQATACKPVSQISDGQIQATSAKAPVTQISDGQIQATSAKAPVTQISDGQIQATTAKPLVSQITDGQIQATTARVSYTGTSTRAATYTGAANAMRGEVLGLAAGVLAAVLI